MGEGEGREACWKGGLWWVRGREDGGEEGRMGGFCLDASVLTMHMFMAVESASCGFLSEKWSMLFGISPKRENKKLKQNEMGYPRSLFPLPLE